MASVTMLTAKKEKKRKREQHIVLGKIAKKKQMTIIYQWLNFIKNQEKQKTKINQSPT